MVIFADADAFLDWFAALDGVFDAPPPEGDPVDLLAHGLQCADVLRARHPADLGLHLAGLVHDIGHATGDGPDHARAGADAVRPLFGDRVADLVGLHVQAKRYLAATEAYELSPASELSLGRQGAAMTRAEIEAFEARPGSADAVALRRADEAAKEVGRAVPGLATWAPRVRDYVRTR
ncbi:HD domain-containing protein [Actinoplanes sp. TBRC 11911]|uniref:HD domain-containing protein n=1 Tax=Actinoplanes sp. TBRC 11911 TaxID=2729386 RepID=UPI00145E6587|nr:HD domain-containing protein [Actinoplanes sp. TBRC 11911]NMO49728.1 HD domain-containing protein [Actinoplanes sp. TBRC 11911]